MDRLFNETDVLEKCDYFVDAHLWPRTQRLDARRWLTNFTTDERPYAVHLLGSFQYFSDDVTNALLRGAFRDLSRRVVDLDASYRDAQAQWRDFRDSLLVSFPTGEEPSPTDSGHSFARKARQELGISEDRILAPDVALAYLASRGSRPLVFVDDFLGSGNQFRETWERVYDVGSTLTSFAGVMTTAPFTAFYLPIMATEIGREALTAAAPDVILAPAHQLPAEVSAVHSDSLFWPESERQNGRDAIESASQRAGFPDTDGSDQEDWQGFCKLGLATAFEHSVPDATLPLFHGSRENWTPLVARA